MASLVSCGFPLNQAEGYPQTHTHTHTHASAFSRSQLSPSSRRLLASEMQRQAGGRKDQYGTVSKCLDLLLPFLQLGTLLESTTEKEDLVQGANTAEKNGCPFVLMEIR